MKNQSKLLTFKKLNMKPFKNYTKQNQIMNRGYQFDIEMYNHQQTKFFLFFFQLLTIKNDDNINFDTVDIIKELDDYSQTYFQAEEKSMLRSNYRHLELHIIQHQLFLSKVDDFRIAQTYKNSVLLEKMILLMRKWFFMHSSEFDFYYLDSTKENLLEQGKKNSVDFQEYITIKII
ncbi:MAG: hemerythrin family protein [Paludibacter sp.]